MDKKALLSELRIDRSEEASSSGRPIKWFVAIAVVAGLGFVGLYVELPTEAAMTPVRTVVAQTVAAAPAGDSVLDATGYVVARRQATVSAKVTGKVLEVLVEEGMTVEAGQLLAQLDDSIPRAQLELSESQHAAARAGLDEMRVQLRQAKLDLARTRGLAERNLASQADLDRDTLSVEALNARLARTQQELNVAERSMAVQRQMVSDMQIRAPFPGVVIAKDAQPGEMISPISAGGGFTRTGICTIVDMDSLE
ncbi:MAG: biotin/lipoyl-binding protein, partial [Gammaproteobacteria bacterium]|nr:biotin/lipoyl-binding protein [Gammaproteobacteria bacterium]